MKPWRWGWQHNDRAKGKRELLKEPREPEYDYEEFAPYPWASRRYFVCQSRMSLWIGLQSMLIRLGLDRDLTKDETKAIIQSFPESTNACRCFDCRYHRLYKKWSGK